jgi:GT2 family glycosyltransferase
VREGLDIEVLIIDNASSDGSALAASNFPATVVVNETNLGYGRANNIGLRLARGRHLMILNPDTVPTPGSLRALIDFADTHARAGIVAPRLLNLDGTTQAAAFHFPTVAMAVLDLFPLPAVIPGRFRQALLRSRMNGRYAEEAGSLPFRIEHPLGACFLIKRDAYEQCGGFNEDIFMYSEEIDLALRFAEQKWECWQDPASEVIHLGGQSTRQLPDRMFVELWRSRLYIYDTYYTLVARLALRAVLVAAMIKRIVMSSVARLSGSASRQDTQKQVRKWARVLRMAVGL